jgi:hypothetical protein
MITAPRVDKTWLEHTVSSCCDEVGKWRGKNRQMVYQAPTGLKVGWWVGDGDKRLSGMLIMFDYLTQLNFKMAIFGHNNTAK